MKTVMDCLPCLVRQTLDACRFASRDEALQEEVLRETLGWIRNLDFSTSPPEVAQAIHARVRSRVGNPDPYREVKRRFNYLALAVLPEMEQRVAESDHPFETAVRLAIAGNAIDFAFRSSYEENDVAQAVQDALRRPLQGSAADLERAVGAAKSILYVTDNAGEIVFDQLLLRQFPLEKTRVAVRGGPILNDATREDLEQLGMTQWLRVVSTGSDVPGVVLSRCSTEFLEVYRSADLVVAKGQGNYETMDEYPEDIFFLFKVKCRVVADKVRHPQGTLLCYHPLRMTREHQQEITLDSLGTIS